MNEATMLLKKQLPSMRKLLRRKTLEREVRASVGQRVDPQQDWQVTRLGFHSSKEGATQTPHRYRGKSQQTEHHGLSVVRSYMLWGQSP